MNQSLSGDRKNNTAFAYSTISEENEQTKKDLKDFSVSRYRTTVLIDAHGKIARVFENVRPTEHSAEVLEALKNL